MPLCSVSGSLPITPSPPPHPLLFMKSFVIFPHFSPHPHFHVFEMPRLFRFPKNSNFKPATIFQKMGEELKERLPKLIKLSIDPLPSPLPPRRTSWNRLRTRSTWRHTRCCVTHTHQRPIGRLMVERGVGAPQWSPPRRVETPVLLLCKGGAVAF